MKIVLSGVETINKGAELMLYAILQEIERRYSDAVVYIEASRIPQGIDYINTKVHFRLWPCSSLVHKLKLRRLFQLFHLPYSLLPHNFFVRDIDLFADASGFAFSDQFKITKYILLNWKNKLEFFSKRGCKIIFLPQAFGPVEKPLTKELFKILNKYSFCIMPREEVSYFYIEKSGLVDMNKVRKYTDFTSLVKGDIPSKYESLRDGICIIPNYQMFKKGKIDELKYISFLKNICLKMETCDKKVYLLNHEGIKDELLCKRIQTELNSKIDVITGLNALEVKGMISSAYLVISSRYHGVASALNSCVPCLATSWSHKYEELFKDFGMTGCILPLDDDTLSFEMINNYLDVATNQQVRNKLKEMVPHVVKETEEMWEVVFGNTISISND